MDEILNSSVKQDWVTDSEWVERVREVGPITCDPCTNEDNPVGALTYYTKETDGLAQSWPTNGIVYVNPEYKYTLDWVKKCFMEAQRGCDIIMLIPCRTDTKAWQRWIFPTAAAVCYVGGRLRFLEKDLETGQYEPRKNKNGKPQNATFPSTFILWTKDESTVASFVKAFRGHGHIEFPKKAALAVKSHA